MICELPMRDKYDASDFKVLYEFAASVYASEGEVMPGLDSRADSDCDRSRPICIGMDYNANINWIVAGQPSGRRLNVLKSFFVKYERKIPALIEDFCTYYHFHENKTVVFYYDSTALGANYAVNDQDFQMAGVSRGRNGFQKQKAGEKLAETEEDLLEHRTDGSDAYDTLYIGCEKFPQHVVFAFDAGGVM